MRTATLLLSLLLAGCGSSTPATDEPRSGQGLEKAAVAAGLVSTADDPTGLYASDTDRLCVVARSDGGYRVGATVDYGPGHRCSIVGTARGKATLQLRFGDDCRFAARFDGDRITFPAVLPAACDRACTGRATLTAFEADRLSAGESEAAMMTDSVGHQLCAS